MEMNNRWLAPGLDMSIIGMDDHEFPRALSLDTIRQNVAHHGAAAARLLLNSMQAVPNADSPNLDRADVYAIVQASERVPLP